MKLKLRIWRQAGPNSRGAMAEYDIDGVSPDMSFLEMLDILNEQLIREGAPARYSWGVAMGLAVTLVWLYTEILRLLSYFQSR